jgi:hypothetical protein
MAHLRGKTKMRPACLKKTGWSGTSPIKGCLHRRHRTLYYVTHAELKQDLLQGSACWLEFDEFRCVVLERV